MKKDLCPRCQTDPSNPDHTDKVCDVCATEVIAIAKAKEGARTHASKMAWDSEHLDEKETVND